MGYKYRKNQIFGKRLKVPKHILHEVYRCTLKFKDFIKYQLDDKIPTSCIIESDRKIVERFGIDKCRELDWELINKRIYDNNISFRDILMSIDPQTEDINHALYELVKNQIKPSDYSPKMSEIYSDRLFEIPPFDDNETYDYRKSEIRNLKSLFNDGKVSLTRIIWNWELFKDKDLSYCLLNDENNKNNITDSLLKEFMNNYGILVPLIEKNNDIYNFINTISKASSEEEKHNYIKQFTDDILSNPYRKNGYVREPIYLTNKEYKEIFKYSSIEEYLKVCNEWKAKHIIEELKLLPKDYFFNTSIPVSELFNYDALSFIGIYGLKNVVDFDNECGHFFTKNNCEMLKLMNDMYLHYDINGAFSTKKYEDENGNYIVIDRPYTKDEFYEAMRKMIVNGPTDSNYINKAPDYRDITGEFRVRNKDLFISEKAPDELQKMFYTKSITPHLLLEHPKYIQFLNGKDLSSCFKRREIEVEHSDGYNSYENFYNFLSKKTDFNGVMKFITEYSDILDIVFDRRAENYLDYEIIFSSNDDIEQIQNRIHEKFRKRLIEMGLTYPSHIPKELVLQCSPMFLDENAPPELQEVFYSRTISTEFILSNPLYRKHLKNVDLEIIYKYMPVEDANGWYRGEKVNLISGIKQIFGSEDAFDVMLLYGKYIEKVFEDNKLKDFKFNEYFSKDDLLDELDKVILQNIIEGNMKYDERIPSHFKNNNPTLFLDADVPPEIKDKFYNREFTVKDVSNYPELSEIMKTTNIMFGFPGDYSWIITMFEESDNIETANYKRMKIASAFSKINDLKLREQFKEYVNKRIDTIDLEKIEIVSEVLSRLEYSNSIELSSFKESIATQLLEADNPLEKLDKIEDVFLRNNLPLCGKMFLVFETLYPDLSAEPRFKFNKNSRVAPQLKDDSLPDVGFHVSDDGKRKIITFNDLLRISIRSNEKSLIEYLDNIEKGNELYLSLKNNNFDISNLNKEEIEVLEIFVSHLETLRENTKKGKEKPIDLENTTLEEKLKVLSNEFQETGRHDLKDRIVRSFGYFAGIKSFNQLKSMIEESNKEQEERINKVLDSINENGGKFKIEKGDFVRCIGNIEALNGSLKTGNYCKEHLGSFFGTSKSDTTPLDVDISKVSDTSNLPNAILNSPTGYGFGNIFVFMKKDNPNLNITRDSEGNLTGAKYEPGKIEIYGTQVEGKGYETHWGARTGMALTDVDCIMYKEDARINIKEPFDENGNVNYEEKVENKGEILRRIKFELAKNGHYIPVIDFSGKLVFTKEEYMELRKKMQGLSYYGINDYKLSDELVTPEIEEIADSLTKDSIDNTNSKRDKINSIIKEVLDEMGIGLKDIIDGDLSPNSVEFVDTGSTGRGTNIPYDGDFDFYMRLDASLIKNSTKFNEFKEKLTKKISQYEYEELKRTNHDDLRFKNVKIDNDTIVDIDISFGVKTNKVRYSTDECIRDRLRTIKKQNPEQYKYVVANIIKAKELLKSPEVNAYKPRRSDKEQGGLGGVGIENWILQNGGSFVEACKTFIEAATDMHGDIVPFDEFKEKYVIWNFGENHFAVRDGKYPHNNFFADNMNENGYQKMANALKEYMKTIEISKSDNESKTMT